MSYPSTLYDTPFKETDDIYWQWRIPAYPILYIFTYEPETLLYSRGTHSTDEVEE